MKGITGITSRLMGLLMVLGICPFGAAAQAQAARPELVAQTGHVKFLSMLVLSADGRRIATGGWENFFSIWDHQSGRLLRRIVSGMGWHQSCAFHPSRNWIAVSDRENGIKVFDSESGKEIMGWHAAPSGPADSPVRPVEIAFSPDGQWLVSGHNNGELLFWATNSWKEKKRKKTSLKSIDAIHYTPDGKQLMLSDLHSLEILDAKSLNQISFSYDHFKTAFAMRMGKPMLAIIDYAQRSVEVKDIATKAVLATLGPFADDLTSLAFSPNSSLLALGDKKCIRIFDTGTWKERHLPGLPEDFAGFLGTAANRSVDNHRVEKIVWALDSASFLTQVGDFSIACWSAVDGRQLYDLTGKTSPVISLGVSRDGSKLAVGRAAEYENRRGVASLWDLATGTHLWRADIGIWRDLTGMIFSPAGDRLYASDFYETLCLGTANGEKMAPICVGGGEVAMSPSGELLAVRNQLEAGNFSTQIVNTQSKKVDATIPKRIGALAFSPDGSQLAINDWRLEIWDAHAGTLIKELERHAIQYCSDVQFAPNGHFLAAAGFSNAASAKFVRIKLWDPATWNELRTFTIDSFSKLSGGMAISPDSREIACAMSKFVGGFLQQNEIHFIDVQTGRTRLAIAAPPEEITCLAFVAAGRFLVTGGDLGSLIVWDVQTGEQRALMLQMAGSSDWVVVTPDGLFDGSAAGMRELVAWRFNNNEIAPVETFFNEFFHPGLLGEILAGEKPRAPKDIASMDRRLPTIRMNPAEGTDATAAVAARRVRVRIDADEAPPDALHAAGGGVRDLRLFRNGSLVKAWRGSVLAAGQKSVVLEADVAIVAGENRLTAYAFNNDNIKSADASLVLTGAGALQRRGVLYVLAVGVNRYANSGYDLKYAVADAQGFAAELQKKQAELKNFSEVRQVALLDEQATRANLLAALDLFSGKRAGAGEAGMPADFSKIRPAQPEDALVIYFAGHGTAAASRFYLIPHDLGYSGARTALDESGLKAILEHSVSDQDLEQALEGVDAGQMLMVIDACNSGQALEAEEKRRGPMNSRGLAQLAYEKGMAILTAAQGYQAALEAAQLGHGYLTFALVEEGLKGAAADREPRDGQVFLREWLDYATTRVPQMQAAKMQDARALKHEVAFVEGEEAIAEIEKRSLQRPRVFYRREADDRPLIITRVHPPK